MQEKSKIQKSEGLNLGEAKSGKEVDLRAAHWDVAERRKRLAEKMPNHSIAILAGARKQYRNSDTEYPFRQESDFYYLTLLEVPDAVMVLVKEKRDNIKYLLFIPNFSKEDAVWVGATLSLEQAKRDYGADAAYFISELDNKIPEMLADQTQIIYTLGQNPRFDTKLIDWVNDLKKHERKKVNAPNVWIDLSSLIHELRLFKTPYEKNLMRKACQISVAGHLGIMHKLREHSDLKENTLKEYELEAEFLYSTTLAGARSMAYPTIVGGGENACVLHYTQNSADLKKNSLVLIDAGCEYKCYASDITRTLPVSGKFSPDQKSIYNLVLQSQMAAIEKIRPGLPWDEIQKTILSILVPGLVKLGILKGEVQKLLEEKAYLKFYMHSSGHWLGLDVHDVGDYKEHHTWRKLEEGMVLTVEPGLYFAPNEEGLDKRWWGIGVRIEDDVLVTEEG